jgi:hypothetical protein
VIEVCDVCLEEIVRALNFLRWKDACGRCGQFQPNPWHGLCIKCLRLVVREWSISRETLVRERNERGGK